MLAIICLLLLINSIEVTILWAGLAKKFLAHEMSYQLATSRMRDKLSVLAAMRIS